MDNTPSVFKTTMPPEDILVRAQQFFSTEHFIPTGITERTALFQGKPPFPWILLSITILGFLFCVVPGVIAYFLFWVKYYKFYNLVVAIYPREGYTEVNITHPDADWARRMVSRFAAMLTPFSAPPPSLPPPIQSPEQLMPEGDNVTHDSTPNA